MHIVCLIGESYLILFEIKLRTKTNTMIWHLLFFCIVLIVFIIITFTVAN